jgi:hypothetical protein
MKLAMLGSRDWPDRATAEAVAEWIDGYLDDFDGTVISGGANGVDTWVQEACERREIPIEVIRPEWRRADGTYNGFAGFQRNEEIIKQADSVVVIWNGTSRGSRDDILLALKYRKHLEVHFPAQGGLQG